MNVQVDYSFCSSNCVVLVCCDSAFNIPFQGYENFKFYSLFKVNPLLYLQALSRCMWLYVVQCFVLNRGTSLCFLFSPFLFFFIFSSLYRPIVFNENVVGLQPG